MWPAPSKNPGHWVFIELPQQTAFYMCCHNSLLEELSVSCVFTGGGYLETCTWFSLEFATRTYVAFCFVSLTVIKHGHEYTYMLSPVSLPSNSEPGVVLRLPIWLVSQVGFTRTTLTHWSMVKGLFGKREGWSGKTTNLCCLGGYETAAELVSVVKAIYEILKWQI